MPRERIVANRQLADQRVDLFVGGRGRRQLRDATDIEGSKRVADAASGNDPIRRNLNERQQNKCAFEQMRVRECQIWLLQCDLVVSQNVDIDRPRAPAPFARPVTAERTFNVLHAYEQGVRLERGRHNDHRIDEGRLVGNAPRRGAVIARARDKPHGAIGAQHGNGAFERSADVAQIAAERQQSFG